MKRIPLRWVLPIFHFAMDAVLIAVFVTALQKRETRNSSAQDESASRGNLPNGYGALVARQAHKNSAA
jgi:hypothetical protein